MKRVFIFSSVEVEPKPRSPMRLQDEDSVGAFVHCLVAEESLSAAQALLERTLLTDGYSLKSFGQPSYFDDYSCKGKVSQDMKEFAENASIGDVWYSPFFCYDKDDR